MRRFEIQAADGNGDPIVVGEGCQFNGGLAAICWAGNPYVLTEMNSDLIDFIGNQVPGTVVWIDKDMSVLSPPEPGDHGKHAAAPPGISFVITDGEDNAARVKLENFFKPKAIDD